jgi:hypothetical protein
MKDQVLDYLVMLFQLQEFKHSWRVFEDSESCINGIFESTFSALIWKV